MIREITEVLARLYAPGIGKAPVRQWPSVVRAIRRAGPGLSSTDVLADAGLTLEALFLDEPYDPLWADAPVRIETATDAGVGALWPLVGRVACGQSLNAVEVSLDAPQLPPAVWVMGDLPSRRRPTLAGIGCRQPMPEAAAFARSIGDQLARRRDLLVSGGAAGCDTEFAMGHGAATAILPHGLDQPRELSGVAASVSAFALNAPFTRERAMRRNALIVAAADLTLVASARLKEGGSWHAALGALRRRAPVAVYLGPGAGSGARALAALGALPIHDADEALAALDLVDRLAPHDDAASRWAELTGRRDGRLQPTMNV